METSELDKFVHKFKNLWKSGLDAHLDIDTSAGQAWVILRVRLGHAPGPLLHQDNPHFPANLKRTRDGPSRCRRRIRRTAARAEKAGHKETEVDEKEAEEAQHNSLVEAEKASDIDRDTAEEKSHSEDNRKESDLVEIAKEVDDEVCPDNDDEIDAAEASRDKMVDKVLIYPVGKSTVEKKVIENEIRVKFEKNGVTVKQIQTKRSYFGEFIGSIAEISPVNLNRIWGRRLGVSKCSIIAFDQG
jgi:hypothetical protein